MVGTAKWNSCGADCGFGFPLRARSLRAMLREARRVLRIRQSGEFGGATLRKIPTQQAPACGCLDAAVLAGKKYPGCAGRVSSFSRARVNAARKTTRGRRALTRVLATPPCHSRRDIAAGVRFADTESATLLVWLSTARSRGRTDPVNPCIMLGVRQWCSFGARSCVEHSRSVPNIDAGSAGSFGPLSVMRGSTGARAEDQQAHRWGYAQRGADQHAYSVALAARRRPIK
jgi:hypothetical protein